MDERQPAVLVVDDQADMVSGLRRVLHLDHFQVESAGSIAEMMDREDWSRFLAILLDRKLPDGYAEDVLPRLKRVAPEASVIIITGHSDLESTIAAFRAGAEDYLLKPVDPSVLRSRMRRIHELRLARESLEREQAERGRAEQAMRQSASRLAAVVETAPSLIVVTDGGGRIVHFNRACEELTGYTREEMIGERIVDRLVPADWRSMVKARFDKPDIDEASQPHENPWLTKLGDRRWIEWRCLTLPQNIQDSDWFLLGIGIDITERKQTEMELARLAAIVESSSDAIVGKSLDGMVVSWNDAAEEIFGYARDEIIGKPIRMLVPPDRKDEVEEILRRIRRGERVQHFETVRLRKEGRPIDVSLTVSPISDAEGQVIGASAISRDITERKRVEQALKESEALTSAILASLPAHVALMDQSGEIVAVNPAWEEFAHDNEGSAHQCNVGANYLDACRTATGMYAEEAPRVAAGLLAILGGDAQEFSTEYPCHSPENNAWFLMQAKPLRNGAGGAVVSHTNITERVKAERELRESEERLRAILNTASDAIINIDTRGIITSSNPAAERMFGYTQGTLVGQNVKILMPPQYSDNHDGYIAHYRQTGRARIIGVGREVVGRHKDGSTFPVGLAVSEARQLGMFTGIIRDLTAVKDLQKQVLEIAAEVDRRIGHELHDNIQQQLTGLGLLAQSLAELLSKQSPQPAELAERLAKGIQQAANDVHLLSRGLVPVGVDVDGLRSALTDLKSRITEQYGVACEFHYEGTLDVRDNFVATHLYRIAQEAVTNAIKHGQAKRIDISLTGPGDNITLEVLDNGIGIGDKHELGMGLQIMQYRAGLIGATVQIGPGKEEGTRVICTVLAGGNGR